MSQASLFDLPAPSTPTRDGIALGDLVHWTAGGETRKGIVIYLGPRIGFYGFSECWRERWEWEQFTKQQGGKLLRGGSDAWVHAPGQLVIARNQQGWWPIGEGVKIERQE